MANIIVYYDHKTYGNVLRVWSKDWDEEQQIYEYILKRKKCEPLSSRLGHGIHSFHYKRLPPVSYYSGWEVRFDDETEAMAFKLRWSN